MTKDEYVLRSLSKIRHKRWELFVVSRILHLLDDPEIEFVCQQLVRRENGERALTDLYFPQLNLHVEIDEGYHSDEAQAVKDELRSRDIVNITGCVLERIQAFDDTKELPLVEIAKATDRLIEGIRALKQAAKSAGRFRPWDYELRYSPAPHMEAGEISLSRGAVFRCHRDALVCFGYAKGHHQRGLWQVPKSPSAVWFPKLYENGQWQNSLSSDGMTIVERRVGAAPQPKIERLSSESSLQRVTFAHGTNPLGETLYRFVGVFVIDGDRTVGNAVVYKRVSDRIDLPAVASPRGGH